MSTSSFLRSIIQSAILVALLFLQSACSTSTITEQPDQVIVQFWQPGSGLTEVYITSETVPERLLELAGIDPKSVSQVLWNGMPVDRETPLAPAERYVLQIKQPHEINLMENGEISTFTSSADFLGEGLWQAGYQIYAADSLSSACSTPLEESISVVLQRSVPVRILVGEKTIKTRSSAASVGKALAQVGLSLQNLDISQPGEDQPLPKDGTIQITRVRERALLEYTILPHTVEYVADANASTGEEWVINPGSDGIKASKTRLRYENEMEIRQNKEADWIALHPVTDVVGYGTQILITTLPDSDIEYWAAVEMYATSYYPCGFSDGSCSYSTASGQALTKGVVAVTLEWYQALKGYRVYIPGYGIGVIADVGGGIPGKTWIDLGYDNNNYVGWSQYVTVYFLPPAPETIPWFLR